MQRFGSLTPSGLLLIKVRKAVVIVDDDSRDETLSVHSERNYARKSRSPDSQIASTLPWKQN
jgi:hypothetical protein